jgi:NAD(P)H-dependent flavin oxidoreductase YrpB (nitropropane dioxygenase family)
MFLQSQYPIYLAGMNRASSVELAVAVREAGCTPTLVLEGASPEWVDIFHTQIKEFWSEVNDHNFMVTVYGSHSFTTAETAHEISTIFSQYRPAFIEYRPTISSADESKITREDLVSGNIGLAQEIDKTPLLGSVLKYLRMHSKIICSSWNPNNNEKLTDAYIMRTSGSAGRKGNYTAAELLKMYGHVTKPLLVQGGVGTPAQLRDILKQGASGVGIGTMFAASQESPLSLEAKQKFVMASAKDLTEFKDTNQNALVFDQTIHPIGQDNNWNRTDSLEAGIETGKAGHVYAGHGIDYIKDILPVKEIVRYLVSELG